MDNCKLKDYISEGLGQKLITTQECLQMKRDMEAENDTDFEASPLALCMMITLLLFGICLWIWLISWSCFFGQNLQNDVKKSEKNIKLTGPRKNEVRLTRKINKDTSNHSIRSQILRNFNPLSDFDILHPGLTGHEGQASTTTGNSETQVSGPPTAQGAIASSFAKESHKRATKKYKIQWTKLFKLRRRGDHKKGPE